jgi:hypothetical protein
MWNSTALPLFTVNLAAMGLKLTKTFSDKDVTFIFPSVLPKISATSP